MLPSLEIHLLSIKKLLNSVDHYIKYIQDAIRRWDDDEWRHVEDIVSEYLLNSVMTLDGILDSMVILDVRRSGVKPVSSMSFKHTLFMNSTLRMMQSAYKNLYADFSSLAQFWKHYFPYRQTRDLRVNGDPVFEDVIVPVYNLARSMMNILELYTWIFAILFRNNIVLK